MSERQLWTVPPATVSEAAIALSKLGWEILPVKPKEKQPATSAWTTTAYGPDDIAPDGNLGVRLAPPLVDIDCDCPEACILAEALLPQTLVSGRRSTPRSHWWFYVETPVGYVAYSEAGETKGTKTMLVELRAGRERYTLIPPSTHPSGEVLQWAGSTLAEVDVKELAERVALVAALTLVARHWPTGNRHHAAGAAAGWLLGHRVPPELVRTGLRAMCQAARDEETEDRLRHVETTIARYAEQQPATGGATLRDIIGESVIDRATGWLKETWGSTPIAAGSRPELAAFNQTHFVTRLGADMVVGEEAADAVTFLTFANFEKLYCNAPKIGTQRASKLWLEAPDRRTYRRVGFAPPGAPPLGEGTYNLWRGFAVSPDPRPEPERRVPRFLEHLAEVICNGDTTVNDYVLDLFAANVQRPGDPIGKVLILRSDQGRGKSITFENFGRLFGRHYMAISSYKQLTGEFNAHLSGKVMMFADEAIWGGHRESVGTLKHVVTQRVIPIQRKNIDIDPEPNYIWLYAATNEAWAWPAGAYERRGVILDVVKKSSEAYFERLWAEVRSRDFLPSLLAYLQARAVDTARLRRGLVTAALLEQQDYTADPVQSWWSQVLDEGVWAGEGAKIKDGQTWPEFLSATGAYDAFVLAMRNAGVGRLGDRNAFQRRWRKLLPHVEHGSARVMVSHPRSGGAPTYENKPMWGIFLPTLSTCRQAYGDATGTARVWATPSQALLDEAEETDL